MGRVRAGAAPPRGRGRTLEPLQEVARRGRGTGRPRAAGTGASALGRRRPRGPGEKRPSPGLARIDPRLGPRRPGPNPREPPTGSRKGAGWLSPAPDPAIRLRPRPRRRGARAGPADGPDRSAGRAASFHDADSAREPPPGID